MLLNPLTKLVDCCRNATATLPGLFVGLAVLAASLIAFSGPVPAMQTLPGEGETFVAKVTRVINCDTLMLQYQRREVLVKPNGIDCPEKRQPYGREAQRYMIFMTRGLDVGVKVVGTASNGALIGEVVLPDGRVLSPLAVEEGMAWWDRSSKSDPKLHEIQELAQASRKGLWADRQPIPPWEWRKGKRREE